MAKHVAEDSFYCCVCADAIFMMVSVPNNLNIQFSTLTMRRNSNTRNQEYAHTHTRITSLNPGITIVACCYYCCSRTKFPM